MRATSHAPFYDLFKLIVAIVLLLLLFLIWNRPTQQLQPIPSASTSTPLPSTPTTASPTSTPLPPTTTPPAPTGTPTQTATLMPPPTEADTDEPLPTPVVEIPSEPEACAATSRSQLEVGMKAMIQRPLNFRSFPGLFNNLIRTNDPGTEVEIVGGPACTRYEQGG
ncbi:MAG TPA: hypothetical protein VK851_00275, partial [Anaerolineales bacterium]|nr:hypothetical protein [Anaerolineales bacterium]